MEIFGGIRAMRRRLNILATTLASDWDNGYRNHMRTIAYAGMNSNGNADNTAYYSKGDYLCFREVSLGYELPRFICSKLKD